MTDPTPPAILTARHQQVLEDLGGAYGQTDAGFACRAALEEITELRRQVVEVTQERDQRNDWLAECYRLSGADPDGNENWRLAPGAVEAVRELRDDSDSTDSQFLELQRLLTDTVTWLNKELPSCTCPECSEGAEQATVRVMDVLARLDPPQDH